MSRKWDCYQATLVAMQDQDLNMCSWLEGVFGILFHFTFKLNTKV